jgi:hypothetical protein
LIAKGGDQLILLASRESGLSESGPQRWHELELDSNLERSSAKCFGGNLPSAAAAQTSSEVEFA